MATFSDFLESFTLFHVSPRIKKSFTPRSIWWHWLLDHTLVLSRSRKPVHKVITLNRNSLQLHNFCTYIIYHVYEWFVIWLNLSNHLFFATIPTQGFLLVWNFCWPHFWSQTTRKCKYLLSFVSTQTWQWLGVSWILINEYRVLKKGNPNVQLKTQW